MTDMFSFRSSYQGEIDYMYWWHGKAHRAEHHGQVLRLLTIETEGEALRLAHLFNDEGATGNLRTRDEILAKYDEEMLRAVWKPWVPVTTVQFIVGTRLVERGLQ